MKDDDRSITTTLYNALLDNNETIISALIGIFVILLIVHFRYICLLFKKVGYIVKTNKSD